MTMVLLSRNTRDSGDATKLLRLPLAAAILSPSTPPPPPLLLKIPAATTRHVTTTIMLPHKRQESSPFPSSFRLLCLP